MAEPTTEIMVGQYKLDLNEFRQQIVTVNSDLKSVQTSATASATGAKQAIAGLGTEIAQTFSDKSIQQGTDNLKKFGDESEKAEAKMVSFRTQIRQNTQELMRMQEAGKGNTAEFKNLVNETAKLQRNMRDTQEQLRNTSQRFLAFRAAGEAVRSVGAAYEVVIGSQALFGSKNEELEKSMKNLMGIMALTNGLTEIGNTLRKDSALMIGLNTARTYAYGTALQVVGAIEEAFGVESAAAWAIATGGLSILVAGVVALGVWIFEATRQIKIFSDNGNYAFTALKGLYESMNLELEKTIRHYEEQVKSGERLLGIAKSQNQDRLTLNSIEEGILKTQLEQAKTVKQQTEWAAEINSHAKERISNLETEIAAQKYLIDSGQADTEAKKNAAERIIKMDEQQLDIQKKILEVQKQNRETEAQILDAENKLTINEIERAKIKVENHIADLERQKDMQTELGQNTLKTDAQIFKLRQALAKNNAEELNKIETEKNKQAIENTITLIEKSLSNGILNETDAMKMLAGMGFSAEKIKDIILKGIKDADEAPEKIQYNPAGDNRAALEKAKGLDASRLQLMQAFNLSRQQIDMDYMKFVDQTGEMDYNKFVEWETKKRVELLKTQETAIDATEKASQAINAIIKGSFEHQQQLMDDNFRRQQDNLAATHDAQVNQVGRTAKQKAMIDEQYAEQQRKLQQKQAIANAELKRQEAIINKVESASEIAINLAKGILAAQAAAAPFLANPVTAAAGAATEASTIAMLIAGAAVQAATIAAQPLPAIPKFKDGVIDFKGKGTTTSDSNLVAMSTGESVMTAIATQRHKEELQAIQTGTLEQLILNKYLKPALQAAAPNAVNTDVYDDFLLRSEVKNTNKNLQELVKIAKSGSLFKSRYNA